MHDILYKNETRCKEGLLQSFINICNLILFFFFLNASEGTKFHVDIVSASSYRTRSAIGEIGVSF